MCNRVEEMLSIFKFFKQNTSTSTYIVKFKISNSFFYITLRILLKKELNSKSLFSFFESNLIGRYLINLLKISKLLKQI